MGQPRAYPVSLASGKPHLVRLSLFGSGLSGLGVLNPEWITNGVYRILNSNRLFQANGVMNINILHEILPSTEYPLEHHSFIIDVMEKFELCYAFDGKSGRFLIPDLLPKSEPDTGIWDDALACVHAKVVREIGA